MWHKPEVYVTIRHPFNLAWRDFVNMKCNGKVPDHGGSDLLWHRHQVEIADEVVRHARIPSPGSARAIRQQMMNPLKPLNFTRDDGVADMSIEQIKRICYQWLEQNFSLPPEEN